MRWLSRYFLHGLLIIVPLGITFLIVNEIFQLAENLLGKYLPVHFPGLSLFVVLAFVVFAGWLSTHWALKRLLDYGEKLLNAIPIVKFIYSSVKQVAQVLFESKQLFKQPVLVPFPHPGAQALGFVMPELSLPLAEKFSGEHVCVYVPMSLNMANGFNIIVPKKDAVPLDITPESALQYVLTAGIVMPHKGK